MSGRDHGVANNAQTCQSRVPTESSTNQNETVVSETGRGSPRPHFTFSWAWWLSGGHLYLRLHEDQHKTLAGEPVIVLVSRAPSNVPLGKLSICDFLLVCSYNNIFKVVDKIENWILQVKLKQLAELILKLRQFLMCSWEVNCILIATCGPFWSKNTLWASTDSVLEQIAEQINEILLWRDFLGMSFWYPFGQYLMLNNYWNMNK